MTIKEFMVDVLMDKLDEYEGNSMTGGDMSYELLSQYNCDGSYTYSTYEAKEWIKMHFDELGEIVDNMTEEGFSPVNVFNNPEGFMVQIMLYVASDMLGQCDTVNEVWNDEFILDAETITKIKEELNNI